MMSAKANGGRSRQSHRHWDQIINHYLGAATDQIQRETAAETATCTGYNRNATVEANCRWYLL
jgi:hypothetical protein